MQYLRGVCLLGIFLLNVYISSTEAASVFSRLEKALQNLFNSEDQDKRDYTTMPTPGTTFRPTGPTRGGTGGGKPCVFPFTYKGHHYGSCTRHDYDRDWCGTDPDAATWGECIYERSLDNNKRDLSTAIPALTTILPPSEKSDARKVEDILKRDLSILRLLDNNKRDLSTAIPALTTILPPSEKSDARKVEDILKRDLSILRLLDNNKRDLSTAIPALTTILPQTDKSDARKVEDILKRELSILRSLDNNKRGGFLDTIGGISDKVEGASDVADGAAQVKDGLNKLGLI